MSQTAPVPMLMPVQHPRQAARWALRLLGAVQLTHVADPADPVVRLPSRAVALLLARLAMAPDRQHAREELVELLWPGVAADVGRNRLRQALSVLRSLLEPAGVASGAVLQADRRALWLSPAAVSCDVVDFQQALRAGHGVQAAAAYGGELLPGYFEEWVQDERRALAEAALRLATSVGLPAAVPTQSPSAPSPVTSAAPLDVRLPQYLTRLVGFAADGAALAAAVPQRRLVVLRGPGGGGKTRLAVEVARALAQGAAWLPVASGTASAAFDLVAFVPLAASSTAAQMHDAVMRAVQTHGDGAAANDAARVERALAGRRVLLVLDNFEQLVEAGRADIARWLARLPQLHLLVTSRRALGLDGEVEHALAALPLPEAGASLQDHAFNPAMTLFVDRARAARGDFHLSERNHAAVADIVSALHGLPLAIELAAARVRSLGLSDLRAMLVGDGLASSRPTTLALLARSGPRGGDDERHASMLKVLAWSWQQLATPEQELLALLSACDGGASLDLLCHLGGAGAASTALLVDELVAASVAYRRESAAGASRYHAFEPMREYVFHDTGAAGLARLRARHAQSVALWATALGTEPALDLTSAEWPNLTRALASGADADLPGASAEQAIDTTLAARWALDDLSLSAQALDHLRHIAAAAPQYRAAALQALLAMQSFNAGQAGWADRHVDAALAALDAADLTERAEVLRCAGIIRLRRGAPLDAVQTLLDQALVLARAHRQPDTEARTLTHWALMQSRRRRDPAVTLPLYRQALALWRRHGPRTRATSGLLSLGLQLGGKRRAAEQLLMLDGVRALATQTGQRRLLALATSVTGYALADLRRFDASAAMYRQCLQMDWEHGFWREWFYVLWNLPRTLACQGKPESAARLMGFAEAYCAEHFGALGPEDLPEARRTRRLIALRTGRSDCQVLWRQGAGMSMAEAMALAMAESAPRPGV